MPVGGFDGLRPHLQRQEYVKRLVLRRNRLTERLYYNDNTIMAWGLLNEPRCELYKVPLPCLDTNEHVQQHGLERSALLPCHCHIMCFWNADARLCHPFPLVGLRDGSFCQAAGTQAAAHHWRRGLQQREAHSLDGLADMQDASCVLKCGASQSCDSTSDRILCCAQGFFDADSAHVGANPGDWATLSGQSFMRNHAVPEIDFTTVCWRRVCKARLRTLARRRSTGGILQLPVDLYNYAGTCVARQLAGLYHIGFGDVDHGARF